MSRIFLSHSSQNNAQAVALYDWLGREGWKDEIFLDLDPMRGIAAGDRWERALNEAADRLLADVSLEARRDLPAGLLSYAEQRALEIGITIAGGADTVLLDEPTAGMSRSEADHAVALIRRITAGKTLVMVEHDMSVVFDLADVVTVLVYGQVIASGPPAEIRANRAVQDAYLGAPAETGVA